MNMNSSDQSAAQAKAWMNHIEMEREAQLKSRIGRILGSQSQSQCAGSPQDKSSGNQERSPVSASFARLADLVNTLDKQAEALTDRLAPVSRPAMLMAGEGSTDATQEPQCSLDDELFTLSARVQSVIDRISSARHRLCI